MARYFSIDPWRIRQFHRLTRQYGNYKKLFISTISIAYGFAPASTIALLGTTTLVSNAILAPILLNEKFRKRGFLGLIFAIIGATGVVYSSKSKETDVSDIAISHNTYLPN